MMFQLSFTGIEIDESPAKVRKAAKAAIAKAVKRVGKKKQPPRRVRKATAAEVQVERKRLAGQALKIYERLLLGSATNVELAEISLKYTSRISDIRKAGYSVTLISHDHGTGLTSYQLGDQ